MKEKKVIRVQDKFNPFKVWVITITPQRKYYVGQEIKGRLGKSTRTTKRHLVEIGILSE